MNKNKTLLYIIGGGALIAGVYYLIKNFGNRNEQTDVILPPNAPPIVPPSGNQSPVVIPSGNQSPVVTPVVTPPVVDQIGKISIGSSVNTTKDTNLYKNSNFTPFTDWAGDFKQIKKGEYLGTIRGRQGAFTRVENYANNNPTDSNVLFILNSDIVKKN